MDISKVNRCDMTECFYNIKNICHAQAINVGANHPTCDTFIAKSGHGGAMDMTGMVGSCKVDNCRYNKNLLCSAPGINVGHHEKHADCKTYAAR